MKTCVLAITEEGILLAQRIAASLENCTYHVIEKKVADTLHTLWSRYDGFICVMATGIVVRAIAPLLQDKTVDPCVVVVDQKGCHAISLLSGHLGGGNRLANEVASSTGGTAVITTATDVLGKTAIDLWAARNNIHIADRSKLTALSTRQVNGTIPKIYCDIETSLLPSDFLRVPSREQADMVITYNKYMTSDTLCCIPEILYLGVGCNRGTAAEDIEKSFYALLEQHAIEPKAIRGLATIDIKNDEHGILQFAETHNLDLSFFTRDDLNSVSNVSFSKAVMKAVGVQGVAEPAALLAAGSGGFESRLIIRKMKWKDVTLAVAERIIDKWD
jgi:cobalt-precorrin 5A hydrolase